MNILPKKSWHVRTKKNIERVRRDEEKAAAEEKEKQKRISIAEQEVRSEFLRQKAGHRSIDAGSHSKPIGTTQNELVPTHINFFTEEEQSEGGAKSGGNAEREKEELEAKNEYERRVGIVKYLDSSGTGEQSSKPWYSNPPKQAKDQEKHSAHAREEEFDKKRKAFLDPKRSMDQYTEKKEKSRKRKHEHKSHKSEKKVKYSGPKSIEQLRKERLSREKAEKLRAQSLLSGNSGETSTEKDDNEQNERYRRYNSQFNPELARKSRSRHDYK